jgi:HK97 family phage prohead protease
MDYLALGKFEIKADNDNTGRITGYGAYYDNVDNGRDVIKSGAFNKINRSVKMLYEHRELIGLWDTIKEDSKGLIVEGNINTKTTKGADAYELAKSGALTDMSVGFKSQDFTYDNKGIRTITKADLYEVSLVSFPMNEKANILSVKSDDITTERDFEHTLKKLGFSNKEAKHIAIFGFKSFLHKKETGELLEINDNSVSDLLKELKSFKI